MRLPGTHEPLALDLLELLGKAKDGDRDGGQSASIEGSDEVKIRPYNQKTDEQAVVAMYLAQGLDYVLPNFEHPEFFTKLVVEEEGRPVMAIMGRVTAEMYLLMDPGYGSPGARLRNFLELHQASESDMVAKGIQDCYAQIPPGGKMEKFKRLLGLLGWVKANTWEPWTKPQLYSRPRLPALFSKLLGEGRGAGDCVASYARNGLGTGQDS